MKKIIDFINIKNGPVRILLISKYIFCVNATNKIDKKTLYSILIYD